MATDERISPPADEERAYRNVFVNWTREQTIALIRSLRRQEVLWNASSKSYRDRKKKAAAWERVEAETGVEIELCKRRVESLLASCRREKNKILKSQREDPPEEVYVPKWHYWRELRFLRPPNSELDEEGGAKAEAEDDPLGDAPRWSPSARRPPRARSKRGETTARRTEPIERDRREPDEFDAWGITVAAKLRRMDENQRLLAENVISRALYEGLTYQLTPSSDCSGLAALDRR